MPLVAGSDGVTVLTREAAIGVDDEDIPERHRVFDLNVLTHSRLRLVQ